jgi:hypothetical protein
MSSVHLHVECTPAGRVYTCMSSVHLHVKCTPACRVYTCMSSVHLHVECTPACRVYTCMSSVHLHVECTPACRVYTCMSSVHLHVVHLTAVTSAARRAGSSAARYRPLECVCVCVRARARVRVCVCVCRLICSAVQARSPARLRSLLISYAAVGPARDGSTYLDVPGPAGKTPIQVRRPPGTAPALACAATRFHSVYCRWRPALFTAGRAGERGRVRRCIMWAREALYNVGA